MSAFRRRLMAMQKKDSIDWDYEWSYLSGEMPNDERFIKNINGGEMTDMGMKFVGYNEEVVLFDKNKFHLYVKFVCDFPNYKGPSSPIIKGFSIVAHSDIMETPEICFSENNKGETTNNAIWWLGGRPHYLVDTKMTYDYNVDNVAILKYDLNAEYTVNGTINGEQIKVLQSGGKQMWYRNKTRLGSKELSEGNAVYLKELKIKVYDS